MWVGVGVRFRRRVWGMFLGEGDEMVAEAKAGDEGAGR